jgi:hypothetical protein
MAKLTGLRVASEKLVTTAEFATNDIQNLSMQELQLLSSRALQAQLYKMNEDIERVKDDHIKAVTKFEIALDEQKIEYEKIKELALGSLRVTEPKYGWMNLTTFGKQYNVILHPRKMGALLRIVGLAKLNSNETTPYGKYIGENKFSINKVFDKGFTNFIWHFERCSQHIDRWLDNNGHFATFYSIQSAGTEKELANLIDQLYKRYCN